MLDAKLRNRTCQQLDRQGQGPSLQGPGQGQGLDLQGQGQGLKFVPQGVLKDKVSRTRINITVCVSIMSIISCCSKIQNELAFWYRGLPRLSWQLAFKRVHSSTNKYNVRAYYVFGSELNWYFGKRCTFRLIA